MIVKDFYKTRNDGVKLFKTLSDRGVYIRKVGTNEVYSEAVDVEDAPFEYEELERLIFESNNEKEM